jgi:hypothetical protein
MRRGAELAAILKIAESTLFTEKLEATPRPRRLVRDLPELLQQRSRWQPLLSDLRALAVGDFPADDIRAHPRCSRPARSRPAGPLRPGHVLGKRYRIVKRIGAGGIGEVYLAHDLVLGGGAHSCLPGSRSTTRSG